MALDPNRWTLRTQDAVNDAVAAAKAANNPEVPPDPLLAALLGQAEGVVLPILQKVGRTPLELRNRVQEALAALPKAYGSDAQLGRDLREVLERGDDERQALGDEYLSTEHLLLALADRLEVSRDELLGALEEARRRHRATTPHTEEPDP